MTDPLLEPRQGNQSPTHETDKMSAAVQGIRCSSDGRDTGAVRGPIQHRDACGAEEPARLDVEFCPDSSHRF